MRNTNKNTKTHKNNSWLIVFSKCHKSSVFGLFCSQIIGFITRITPWIRRPCLSTNQVTRLMFARTCGSYFAHARFALVWWVRVTATINVFPQREQWCNTLHCSQGKRTVWYMSQCIDRVFGCRR